MMTRKLFLNVLIISVLLTVIYLFLSTIVYFSLGYSVEVDTEGITKAKFENMSYKEAMEYMREHLIKLGFIDTMKKRLFSIRGVFSSLELFITIFITSLITTIRVLKITRNAPVSTAQLSNAKT